MTQPVSSQVPPAAYAMRQSPYPQQPYAQQPYAQQPYAQQPYAHQPYGGGPAVLGAPPRRRAARAWLIGGLVALLIAGGLGLVFLLHDASPSLVAEPPSGSDAGNGDEPASDPDQDPDQDADPDSDPGTGADTVPSAPTDCLVECSETDPSNGPGEPGTDAANFTGSVDVAVGFVQAIADADLASAHGDLCAAGLDLFATPAELVEGFYATLQFTTINGGNATDVYASDATHDAVVFELETDAGLVGVEVYIVEEGSSLAVCGYGPR